jgi:hypothetical protein
VNCISFLGTRYEPSVWQKTDEQEALAGPAEPGILQLPSTASSGLRLMRMSLGGEYSFAGASCSLSVSDTFFAHL